MALESRMMTPDPSKFLSMILKVVAVVTAREDRAVTPTRTRINPLERFCRTTRLFVFVRMTTTPL